MKKTKFTDISKLSKLSKLKILDLDCDTILLNEVKINIATYFFHHIRDKILETLSFWYEIDDELINICQDLKTSFNEKIYEKTV